MSKKKETSKIDKSISMVHKAVTQAHKNTKEEIRETLWELAKDASPEVLDSLAKVWNYIDVPTLRSANRRSNWLHLALVPADADDRSTSVNAQHVHVRDGWMYATDKRRVHMFEVEGMEDGVYTKKGEYLGDITSPLLTAILNTMPEVKDTKRLSLKDMLPTERLDVLRVPGTSTRLNAMFVREALAGKDTATFYIGKYPTDMLVIDRDDSRAFIMPLRG